MHSFTFNRLRTRPSATQDFKRTVREVKNTLYAYTEMEQVRAEKMCASLAYTQTNMCGSNPPPSSAARARSDLQHCAGAAADAAEGDRARHLHA